jgi:hypothetical protein
VAQLICNELFRQEPRPTAMAVAQGVNWTSNFVLTMAFKFMQVRGTLITQVVPRRNYSTESIYLASSWSKNINSS